MQLIPGHTAEFELEYKDVELSNIPNRTGTFILDNVHFHYGPVIGTGYGYQVRLVKQYFLFTKLYR